MSDVGVTDVKSSKAGLIEVVAGALTADVVALASISVVSWVAAATTGRTRYTQSEAVLMVGVCLAVGMSVGGFVAARGFARLGVKRGWLRVVLGVTVAIVGMVLTVLVAWLAGVSVQSSANSMAASGKAPAIVVNH